MNGRNDNPGQVATDYERFVQGGSGAHAPANNDYDEYDEDDRAEDES